MDLGLEGKVAIVTGGSMGIGRGVAMSLALEGVDIAICARGMEVLEKTAAEIISGTGRKVLPVRADITNPDDIKTLAASTVAELGGVDILVNNAVSTIEAPFMEFPDEAWLHHFNVKTLGYVRCAREVIPYMRNQGGGRIINIGGTTARSVSSLNMSGGVNNSAISNLTKNLSNEFAKDGILVNCIHPGATRSKRLTQSWEARARDENVSIEEIEARTSSTIPIGRILEPEEIGSLVLFLASDKASAITGQTIAADGGGVRGIFY